MSRKRNKDNESPTETATAVSEPAATEAGTDGQGFAERVGHQTRIPVPDPYEFGTDPAAGARLFESKRDRQMAIQFGEGRPEAKPSQAVINKLMQAGYQWNSLDRIWAYPVEKNSAMTTRIAAERLFRDICQMIRHEKGIDAGQEIPH